MGRRALWLTIVLGTILCLAGGVVWVRSQVLALPAWYEALDPTALPPGHDVAESGSPPEGWVNVPDAVEVAERAPSEDRRRPGARQELRNFHLRAMAKEPAFRRAIKGSRAVYRDGKMDVGAVIAIDEIPRDKLTPQGKSILRRVERVFPGLKGKSVYVGLEDEPVVRDGILQLGENPQVKIGNLGMSLHQLARRMGMSPDRVRRDLDQLFRQLGVTSPSSSGDLSE